MTSCTAACKAVPRLAGSSGHVVCVLWLPAQLRAFALARDKAGRLHTRAGEAMLSAHLKLVGSCRNAADERLLHSLQGS